jgi:hypothetical protein
MRRLEAWLPGGRALLAIDVGLCAWTLVWLVVGIAISIEVRGLGELSGTVGTIGGAVEASGTALGALRDLPLVGGAFSAPAEGIREAGRSARASGLESRQSIDALSTLLGLAVALIPSVPLIAIYLPARISRRNESRALGSAYRLAREDPAFQEFLARRAAQSISYRQLSRTSREPWHDLAEGRYERLARAELERLGIVPDRGRGERR